MARHVAFWISYYLYSVLKNLSPQVNGLFDPDLYTGTAIETLSYLPVYLLSVYFSVYIILPKFLEKKQTVQVLSLTFFMMVIVVFATFFISRQLCIINHWPCTSWQVVSRTVEKSGGELMIITGSAVILKIMKDYALRQRESEMLALENVRHSLALLKIQLHPRILFASLQSIAENIETGARHAPEMILKLSDLLSYLLYESESNKVALPREIKMIQDYGDLKKLISGHRLDVYMETAGDAGALEIVPGLLLPLLEIGMAPDGAGNDRLRVTILLKAEGSAFYFRLQNNRAGMALMKTPGAQAAIDRIKETVHFFYPHYAKLDVQPAADHFVLTLQLRLDKDGRLQAQTRKNARYAHS